MNRSILAFVLLALPLLAHSALYKCEKANKTVSYSDKPCPTGSSLQAVNAAVKVGKEGANIDFSLGSEWRPPYYSETANDADWRAEVKESYYVAKGDFDGDGVEDSAYLLVSRSNNESAVVVYLSSQNFHSVPIFKEKGLYVITGHGLTVVPPDGNGGAFKISCRAVVGGCLKKFSDGDAASKPIEKYSAIAYFKKNEKNNPTFFVWDAEEKRFYSLIK